MARLIRIALAGCVDSFTNDGLAILGVNDQYMVIENQPGFRFKILETLGGKNMTIGAAYTFPDGRFFLKEMGIISVKGENP